jgi:signal transduction histidine kinase/ligand-binding sensor domain-containing protein
VRDGFAKGFIYSIAQTPDGYIWIGTEFGLLRFDGVRAVPWQQPTGQQLPGNDIPNLLVTRDGALWIGTYSGLARWKDGQLTTYVELSGKRISSLLQDRDGTVWIGTTERPAAGKLCSFRDDRIECHGGDGNFGEGVYPLFEDSTGNLWAGVRRGFWKWKPGRPEFFAIPKVLEGHPSFGQNNESALLIGTDNGMQRFVNGRVEGYPLPGLSQSFIASRQKTGALGMFRDRDGGLWIATLDRGLVHFHLGKTEVFSEADGLSGDTVVDLLEDREGNIWAATPNGLDRFRGYAVPNIGNKQGLSNTNTLSILASKDGSIWIATYDGLSRWRDGQISVFGRGRGIQKPDGLNGQTTSLFMAHSLFEDSSRRIWVATIRKLGYLENDRFVPVRGLPDGWVDSIAEVPTGHIWVTIQQQGLFHLVQGRVVQKIPLADLGHTDDVRVLLADRSQHGLWLGFAQGGVAYFADGRIQASYSVAEGLGAGRVNGLTFGMRGALWVATERGLSRIKDGRIITLTSRNGLPCETVHWSMDDDSHYVWIYLACGLVRIVRPEWDAWIVDPGRYVKTMLFDNSDGVGSHSHPSEVHGVTKAPDGSIWFVDFNGVSVVYPHRVAFNQLPPPVQIEQVTADGKIYDAAQGLRLPPLVRDLVIDYTALSLVVPEKVHFRYKLEGQDQDWKEVVNDRQVQYSNLAPGKYRFRVMACNNSGVWNEQGALLDFSIAPAFYQATWFRALCVAAFLGLLFAGFQFRVRQLATQFNRTLEARMGERTRIARELHDTLLQSFQGLLLRFQSASNFLPTRPIEAKQRLDSALDQAAKAVVEGRDAVLGLRSSAFEVNDLANGIIAIGEVLTIDGPALDPPAIDVEVEGTPRNLNPIVHDEVYRIAGEALRNAFRHAQAQRVTVEIRYDKRQFRLWVRDDGKGIDEETLQRQPSGHFGLYGMRERAEIVGGRLEVWSKPDSGTQVELSIPGTIAYGVSPRQSWLSRVLSGNSRAIGRKKP